LKRHTLHPGLWRTVGILFSYTWDFCFSRYAEDIPSISIQLVSHTLKLRSLWHMSLLR